MKKYFYEKTNNFYKFLLLEELCTYKEFLSLE